MKDRGWDWEWGGYYPPAPPKQPPPPHGIKVKKPGATWWGQRWIAALEDIGISAARLQRGRSYARQGRVHDLQTKGGTVTARVTGTRPTPYTVRLRLAPLGARAWAAAIRVMAGKARFAAALLIGQMPREIDEAFHAARASLFPARPRDLETECSCPDWANPCKHVAALHFVLGETFDRDPFLLFGLRGQSKDEVLSTLRKIRSTAGQAASDTAGPGGGHPRSVTLAGLSTTDYDRLMQPVDALHFHIGEPAAPGALLRQLGAPASWRLAQTPAELLQAAVSTAAALARELALGSAPAADTRPSGSGRRVGPAARAGAAPRRRDVPDRRH